MKKSNRSYRKGAIAYIINDKQHFLLVQLNSYGDDQWNFLGGGRKENETAEENVIREVKEELNIEDEDIQIIARAKQPLRYDFPDELFQKREPIALKYKGQEKEQFFILYKGEEEKIEFNRNELKRCKWVEKHDLKKYLLFPGQLKQAEEVLNEFFINYKVNDQVASN